MITTNIKTAVNGTRIRFFGSRILPVQTYTFVVSRYLTIWADIIEFAVSGSI